MHGVYNNSYMTDVYMEGLQATQDTNIFTFIPILQDARRSESSVHAINRMRDCVWPEAHSSPNSYTPCPFILPGQMQVM